MSLGKHHVVSAPQRGRSQQRSGSEQDPGGHRRREGCSQPLGRLSYQLRDTDPASEAGISPSQLSSCLSGSCQGDVPELPTYECVPTSRPSDAVLTPSPSGRPPQSHCTRGIVEAGSNSVSLPRLRAPPRPGCCLSVPCPLPRAGALQTPGNAAGVKGCMRWEEIWSHPVQSGACVRPRVPRPAPQRPSRLPGGSLGFSP